MKELQRISNESIGITKKPKKKATYIEHRKVALDMIDMELNISINSASADAMDTYYEITSEKRLHYTKKIKEKIIDDLFNLDIWDFGRYETIEEKENTVKFCIEYVNNIEDNLENNIYKNISWDLNEFAKEPHKEVEIIEDKKGGTLITRDNKIIQIKDKEELRKIRKYMNFRTNKQSQKDTDNDNSN